MLQIRHYKSYYRFLFPIIIVVFLLVGVFTAVVQAQSTQNTDLLAATTNCSVTTSQLIIKTQEQQLFGDINTYRSQKKLKSVVMNKTLKQAATWMSLNMLSHNVLSHTDSLKRTTDTRLIDCGYNIRNGYGENIARGSSNPTTVFDALKNSASDNQIMLGKGYTAVGIDTEKNTNGTVNYWTVDFGVDTASVFPTPTIVKATPVTIKPTPTISNINKITPTKAAPKPTVVNKAPSTGPLTPTAEPVSPDMIISVSIKINGIGQGGNENPLHKTRQVTVNVYGVATTPVTTGTGYLTYDGSNYFTGVIHLGKLSQGAYFIKLVSPNTLQVLAQPAFQTLKIGKTNVIPAVTLYQGDLNGDNILDINDFNIALPCFQNSQCTDMRMDFNDDGVINVLDYNLFLQSYEVLHGD